MKRSKFTEAQIAFVLKQVEHSRPVGEVCRKARVSHTYRVDSGRHRGAYRLHALVGTQEAPTMMAGVN